MNAPTDPPEPPDAAEQSKPEPPRSLFGRFAKAARGNWRARARAAQIPPDDFSVLLLLAGRGSGKNWSAANYVHEQASSGAARRIALIGTTDRDVRFTMIEGESGILTLARPGERPTYEPGKAQLTWPNGSIARLYSADQPESLRGPEHDLAWCDELAAWRRADETWSNLLLTMRIGKQPRVIATTTPKPTRLVRELVARDGTDGIVVRRMSTYDNRANLAPQFFAQLVRKFEGTRLARQELLAEVLEDTPGALWNRELLEATRVEAAPALQRIVISVDPAGSTEDGSDETGIIVAGLGVDGCGYVLSDLSGRYAPNEWARKAIGAFHSLKADKIVVERNYGGAMVAATLSSIDPGVPVKEISSSRGKVLRAEPIASFFEQRRAHIVGSLPELEDQMCSFTSDWNRARDGSPDRVDALTFALSELLLTEAPGGFIRTEAMLSRRSADGAPEPIETPRVLDGCFASIAAGVGAEPDAIGIVFFGLGAITGSVPLIILDWAILRIESDTIERLFPAIQARFEDLRAEIKFTGALNFGATLVEPDGVGDVIYQQAYSCGHDVHVMENEKQLAMTIPQRAVAAGAHVASGKVQITKEAHEHLQEYRGVTKNHLLAHVGGFGMEQQPQQAGALLVAFANGVLEALGGAA